MRTDTSNEKTCDQQDLGLNSLRVSRLIEHDFMRIRAIDIQPGTKSLIILRGDNEQGKTSAIIGLKAALEGKRADPTTPIRQGSDGATVVLTLADHLRDRLRLNVSWTPKGRYLTLRSIEPHGETQVPAGQTVLGELVGALSFDPLAFMSKKPKEQLQMLMSAISKAVAFQEIQEQRTRFFETRTLQSRELKAAKQTCFEHPDPAPGKTLIEQSREELQAELDKAAEHNAKIQAYITSLKDFRKVTNDLRSKNKTRHTTLKDLEIQMSSLKAVIEEQQRLITQREQKEDAASTKLTTSTPISTNALMSKVQANLDHNTKVKEQKRSHELTTKVKTIEDAINLSTKALEAKDQEVCDLLNRSDLGKRIPGLTVNTDNTITHNGLDISQASGMRQLELSCLIGMATNPRLKVMCIDEGDKLDANSLGRLREIAEENDFQIWMTAIYAGNNKDKETITIQDGMNEVAASTANQEVAQMYDNIDPNNKPNEGHVLSSAELNDLEL